MKKPTPRPRQIWRYVHEDEIVVRTIARIDPPEVYAPTAWWTEPTDANRDGPHGTYVHLLVTSPAWSCIGVETARSVVMVGEDRLARDLGVCDGLVTVIGVRDDGDLVLRSKVDGSVVDYPATVVASWPLVPFTDRAPEPDRRPALGILAADFGQELRRAEAGDQHARKSGNADHAAEARAEVRVWGQALAKLRNVLAGRHPDAPPPPVEIEIVEGPTAPAGPPSYAALDAAIEAIVSAPTAAMVDRAESWCREHGVDLSKAADLAGVFQCWAAEYHRRGAHDEAVATALRARAAARDEPTPDEPFGFDEAIRVLKVGGRVHRAGWNGRGMHLFVAKPELHWPAPTRPSICIHGADGNIVVGWTASQADMLAGDWRALRPEADDTTAEAARTPDP